MPRIRASTRRRARSAIERLHRYRSHEDQLDREPQERGRSEALDWRLMRADRAEPLSSIHEAVALLRSEAQREGLPDAPCLSRALGRRTGSSCVSAALVRRRPSRPHGRRGPQPPDRRQGLAVLPALRLRRRDSNANEATIAAPRSSHAPRAGQSVQPARRHHRRRPRALPGRLSRGDHHEGGRLLLRLRHPPLRRLPRALRRQPRQGVAAHPAREEGRGLLGLQPRWPGARRAPRRLRAGAEYPARIEVPPNPPARSTASRR